MATIRLSCPWQVLPPTRKHLRLLFMEGMIPPGAPLNSVKMCPDLCESVATECSSGAPPLRVLFAQE